MKKIILVLILLLTTQLLFSQKTILWRVIDTVNNKTSTIIGTVHQMGNTFIDSIPEIQENLYNSELAIFESITNEKPENNSIQNRKRTLEIERILSKTEIKELSELYIDFDILYKLKPIELRWKLAQTFFRTKCNALNTKDNWDNIDDYLKFLAKEHNIRLFALESQKEQLEFINKANNYPSWEDEKKKIHYWIRQLKSENPNLSHCNSLKKYKDFDINYQFKKNCSNNLLTKQRNENWLKILPKLLRKKNCFIAVGINHLLNDCGLIVQLKLKGFKVQPINIRPAGNKS